MGSQELSVNWNAHSSALVSEFQKLLLNKSLVDCTVAAEGQYLRVHKVVLSACSPYFQILLNEESEKHPIIILRDVKFEDLKRIIEFVYHGEVKLPEEKLFEFLSVAESLQIKGLGDKSNEAFGKRPIVDLLSKKRPEILSSSEHILNQSSSSGNVIEKSISCVKLSSSQNSNSQPQIQQPFTNSIDIPSSSRSPSSSSNVITAIVRNNNRGSAFSCSETKPFQDNVEHLPPFSISDVKEEIIIDDDDDDDEDEEDIVTKEEYSYDEIGNEFLEESYDIDTGNQDVKPSTSQQYTVPKNVSAETQVGELNRVEGISASFAEAILHPDHSPLSDSKGQERSSTHGSSIFSTPTMQQQPSNSDSGALLDIKPVSTKGRLKVSLYACDVCNYSVQRDMNVHTDTKRFLCEVCSSVLRYVTNIDVYRSLSEEGKPYKCDVCSMIIGNLEDLRLHVVWHEEENDFKCNVCLKTFVNRSILKRHMLTHTGERPFQCSVCHKGFNQRANMKVHMRVHTGEKPFKCDVCNKMFRNKSHLINHRRIHAGEFLQYASVPFP